MRILSSLKLQRLNYFIRAPSVEPLLSPLKTSTKCVWSCSVRATCCSKNWKSSTGLSSSAARLKKNHSCKNPAFLGFSLSKSLFVTRTGDGETDSTMESARAKIQEILKKDEKGGWDTAWVQGVTPWDLGGVHPLVADLVASGTLPAGRVLVPGCGAGWDALALAGPTRHVVGLDLSETAMAKARELAQGRPGADHTEFVAGDFFRYTPSEPFALAFDYTFFCAIPPQERPQWAKQYSELLAPEGELITLMFPLGDHEGGPPYAVSLQAYEEVLAPLGFEAVSVVPVTNSVGPRMGKEALGRWKRKAAAKI